MAFLEGRLAPDEIALHEAHIDTCPECFALLAALCGTGAGRIPADRHPLPRDLIARL